MEILDYEGYASNFLHLPKREGDHFVLESNGCGCCSDTDELTREETLRVLQSMMKAIRDAMIEVIGWSR